MNPLVAVAAAAAIVIVIAALPIRPRGRRVDDPTGRPAPARLAVAAIAWRRQRAAQRPPSARAVAAWCDDLARSVRSGSTLRDALTTVGTDDPAVRSALAPLGLAMSHGASVAEAVRRIDHPGQHLALALSVVGTASRIGGPSAAAIDRTAMALRRRAAEVDDRSTQAAQARLSTHVLTALPLLMLAVLAATDADVRTVVASPLGAGCIGAGLALNLVGWWWMGRIVGSAQRA
jgi:tight adherence protein B